MRGEKKFEMFGTQLALEYFTSLSRGESAFPRGEAKALRLWYYVASSLSSSTKSCTRETAPDQIR